ncbi:hypothetical protein C8Q77DRAFT_1070087 [Trametes polyzona]|nr:hypothetical protein C8Q77DRAFT_1070087 [Trametes polyzona]
MQNDRHNDAHLRDSKEVSGFFTLGGQVEWAARVYRHLERRESAVEPVREQETGQEEDKTTLQTNMDELMNSFLQPTVWPPSPELAREDPPLAHTVDPMTTIPRPGLPTEPTMSLPTDVSSAAFTPTQITTTFKGMQTRSIPVSPPSTSAATYHPDAIALAITHTALSARTEQANAEASSSRTRHLEAFESSTASGSSTATAGPSRDKGKAIARSTARKERAKPYVVPHGPGKAVAREGSVSSHASADGSRKKGNYSPKQPPEGFVTVWTERDASWRWAGEPIDPTWAPEDVWVNLKGRYGLTGNSLCRWEGCSAAATGRTPDLRKHVLGVHLRCGCRCIGCDCLEGRFDNWRRTLNSPSGHKVDCPTKAFHEGRIGREELDVQLGMILQGEGGGDGESDSADEE